MNNPEYTQGICEDGAAILREGQPMTVEEILDALRNSEQLKADVEQLKKGVELRDQQNADLHDMIADIHQERDQLRVALHGAVDDFIERISAAKQTIKCEDSAGLFVSVGAINNGVSHIRKSINEPTDCIVAHDAEVIDRAIDHFRGGYINRSIHWTELKDYASKPIR